MPVNKPGLRLLKLLAESPGLKITEVRLNYLEDDDVLVVLNNGMGLPKEFFEFGEPTRPWKKPSQTVYSADERYAIFDHGDGEETHVRYSPEEVRVYQRIKIDSPSHVTQSN